MKLRYSFDSGQTYTTKTNWTRFGSPNVVGVPAGSQLVVEKIWEEESDNHIRWWVKLNASIRGFGTFTVLREGSIATDGAGNPEQHDPIDLG